MAGREKFEGLIQVYTGNGKGKTTAALGLALRAAGWGQRSYIGQFMKGQAYGELKLPRLLKGLVTIEQFGRKGFLHVGERLRPYDIRLAAGGLQRCREAMLSGRFRVVVLDEINVAVYFKLISEQDVLDLMQAKPDDVELVLTGRCVPASFIKRADLVTEMKEVKHYYTRGVQARKGIER